MATEEQFWGRAPETDADRLALKAKVAREALIAATENDPSPEVAHYGQWVANHASNVTLAKLGRMLK